MKYVLKFILVFAALTAVQSAATAAGNLETEMKNAKKSQWEGFERYDFKFDGKNAVFVSPKAPRKDRAWVMRPAFFGAFPKADKELLKRGFYLAYLDLTHRYASPSAVADADKFYDFAINKCGLSKKVALEGLSRGGAFSLAWANSSPSKFSAVYVDAPVCDFLVWPGLKRKKLLEGLMKEWGISSMEGFGGSPIDNLENFAKSGVPLLLIAGDSDKTVPYESNGKIYVERFKKSGGNVKTIIKKGCDHHPHGLDDPTAIVEFIEKAYPDGK